MVHHTSVKMAMGLLIVMLIHAGIALHAGALPSSMAPEAVTFTSLGGVQVGLFEADHTARRLMFTIRGEDVTQVSATVPIRFTFDTPITHLDVRHASSPVTVKSAVVDRMATFFLTREPFAPPQAWQYQVVIELETLPESGQIQLGPDESREMIFHLPPAPRPET